MHPKQSRDNQCVNSVLVTVVIDNTAYRCHVRRISHVPIYLYIYIYMLDVTIF